MKSTLQFLAFPGINYRMGAMIIAEIGDFNRFDSPDKILAYAAFRHQHINPDNWMVPTHIWKNVAPDTCDTLCTMPPSMSATGIQHLQPILLKKRAEGKHYNVAISHAVKKTGSK